MRWRKLRAVKLLDELPRQFRVYFNRFWNSMSFYHSYLWKPRRSVDRGIDLIASPWFVVSLLINFRSRVCMSRSRL